MRRLYDTCFQHVMDEILNLRLLEMRVFVGLNANRVSAVFKYNGMLMPPLRRKAFWGLEDLAVQLQQVLFLETKVEGGRMMIGDFVDRKLAEGTTFYNGLKHEVRSSIDAASGGTFMAKTPEAAKTLLDDMAANNNLNDWSISRGAPKKGAKIDQLSSGPVAPICEICEVQGHSFTECQYNNMGAGTEHVNALLNTNTRPQNNPYSNTFNPGWKHHPNFSYKNNQPQPPHTNYSQPPGFQQRPPFNPSSSSSRPNLETIMENLASSQAKQVEYQAKQNEFFNNSLQQITAHNKLMESQMTQLAQQISHLSKPSGQLPGQTEPNPKGHINAISLRSGKELQEPARRVTEQNNTAKEVIELSEEVQEKTSLEDEAKKPEKEEPTVNPIKPYKPPVPFPQRLAQAKLEKKYGKFLDNLKKLHINIPFLDAISEMPSYANAILQNKLPEKLGDPGSYSIPVKLGDIAIKNALCDLGVSVSLMPSMLVSM
ncbi:uncharacterized protein LOC104886741 [Beta vulgaris subsp. vulgaris]|uniref:uncharacterized protein LOC104886741 n=1 Tax=Beta vulgaris subsp. vulgaris TaxID=3555 RepID=UPI002548F8C3|nr:uncharacterized protein LOC104886741 [Beta vulgaris subsp. vulgaris]